jgi:hypothetical protein
VWWSSVVVLLTTGCNVIFPVQGPDSSQDAATPVPVDAERPLVPPDGATSCGPPPSFASWVYRERELDPITDIKTPTFTGPDRVMFSDGTRLFEMQVDATSAAEVDALTLIDGSKVQFPGSAPSGDMIWFNRSSANNAPSVGNYYARRDGAGWVATKLDFGITALQMFVANVGFHNGTARMIVTLEPTAGSGLRLVELESLDGVHWTPLATLPFSTGMEFDIHPTIAADGCFVLFRHMTGELMVAARGADGSFLAPEPIAPLMGTFGPAINPLGNRLWAIKADGRTIIDGHP